MKSLFFRLFKFALLGWAIYHISLFCIRETEGFTLSKISSDLTYDPAWDIPLPSLEEQQKIRSLLDQRFYYLGAGGQCYAFESEDHQYVIKFFKHHLRSSRGLWTQIPLPEPFEKKRSKKIQKRLAKLHRDFNSYKLAYEALKEETGVLFIHLNKTKDLLQKKLLIVDKLGIEHSIDLDPKEFILQKRADLVYPTIQKWMEKQDLQQVRNAIHSILEVIIARCKKGIFDEDARIHRNFGFIGSQAVIIDVGRFRRDSARQQKAVYLQDLQMITRRFKTWLSVEYPLLVPILEEELAKIDL